jgi:hypothetical protein
MATLPELTEAQVAFENYLNELINAANERKISLYGSHRDLYEYYHFIGLSINDALDCYLKFQIRWDALKGINSQPISNF